MKKIAEDSVTSNHTLRILTTTTTSAFKRSKAQNSLFVSRPQYSSKNKLDTFKLSETLVNFTFTDTMKTTTSSNTLALGVVFANLITLWLEF
jgi:hypothetical protein